MFTAYFDDSGTDPRSDIAIAACYISTKRGWDEFVEAWDRARWEEGFPDVPFHMAEFVAPREHGHRPWCDWDKAKKDHVYKRLATIINENKRAGIAVATHKETWDRTPEYIRQHYGREHYTFAARVCLMRIAQWREQSLISLPIRYIFDFEMSTSQKRQEIAKIFDIVSHPKNEHLGRMFGVEPGGYGFEDKKEFKPLQAADILAWQMRNHMRKIWPLGRDDEALCHPGFRFLREDQKSMDLGFFTPAQIDDFVQKNNDMINAAGRPLPVWYP